MARETWVSKKRPDGTIDVIPKSEVSEWTAKWLPPKKQASITLKRVERGTWVWRNGQLVKKSAQIIELHRGKGLQVIKDIEPYRAIGIDNSVVSGRRQHRDLLKAHGCIELGTEKHEQPKEPPQKVNRDVVDAIKRAMGKL